MTVTRREFAKAIGAAVPFVASSAMAEDEALPEQNPGEFVLQRPSPLDPSRKVSVLGFGGVRLPVSTGRLGNQTDPVDYATATKYVDYATASTGSTADTTTRAATASGSSGMRFRAIRGSRSGSAQRRRHGTYPALPTPSASSRSSWTARGWGISTCTCSIRSFTRRNTRRRS